MTQRKNKGAANAIALNKKARHDYAIEERFEAGIVLRGWEVKSLRAGKLQLTESYALLRDGEAFLFGALIAPLPTASTHVKAEPQRTRKLLLHRAEINQLSRAVERKGYTLVPLAMRWKRGRAKLELGLAKGKKTYDKRRAERDRDWQREQQRLLKQR